MKLNVSDSAVREATAAVRCYHVLGCVHKITLPEGEGEQFIRRPVATLAFYAEEKFKTLAEEGDVYVGVSLLHRNDNFNRGEGRLRAGTRALAGYLETKASEKQMRPVVMPKCSILSTKSEIGKLLSQLSEFRTNESDLGEVKKVLLNFFGLEVREFSK